MSEFARFQKEKFSWNGQRFFPVDNIARGNCNFLAMMDSRLLPCKDAKSLRASVVEFGLGSGRFLAERLFDQFRSMSSLQTFAEYFQTLRIDGTWTGNFEQCLVSALFGVHVMSLSNTLQGIIPFNSSEHMRMTCFDVEGIQQMIPDDHALTIYLYHHQYQRPFRRLSAGSAQINHFCALLPCQNETGDKIVVIKD